MSKTSLNKLIGKRALAQHSPGEQWPIPEQFIGLEIELEQLSRTEQHTHINNGEPYWEAHNDGSLRNGVEYVLSEPLMGSQLSRAISYFFNTFKTYTISPRTSIHVHLNMRQDDDTLEGLKNFLVLYYMYENAFFRLADDNRKWCAYCNPFEDNPPEILTDVLQYDPVVAGNQWLAGRLHMFAEHNTNRYYGLNIAGLQRFGTLEFRHFPLVKDEQRLVDWVTLIMELKMASRRLADEGLQIPQFVTEEQDVQKLAPYFPRFWHLLSGQVPNDEAYRRMAAVMGLLLPTIPVTGRSLGDNKAWATFLKEQEGRGKTKPVPAKAGMDKPAVQLGQADIEAQFQAAWAPPLEVRAAPARVRPREELFPDWNEILAVPQVANAAPRPAPRPVRPPPRTAAQRREDAARREETMARIRANINNLDRG